MNEVAQDLSPESGTIPLEQTWPLRYITLAGLRWPGIAQKTRTPVLMIHGWLDNAMSFSRLAPLVCGDRDVYAVDLAGHGQSGHRPPGQGYPIMDYVADVAELIEDHISQAAGADKVDLVGHSLGGIVAMLYTAAFPERVRRLVMIDSLGPLTREPSDTIPQMRKAINKRLTGSGKPAVYQSIEVAAKAREGGMIPLTHQGAMTLTPRNLCQVGEGYCWSTDARLRHPTMMMMDEAQVTGCLNQVQTPTRFLRAEHGLLANRPELDSRADAIDGLEVVSVPGGHHCHLEGPIEPVTKALREFFDDV